MEKRPVLMKVEVPFCVEPCDYCTRDVMGGWDSQRMKHYVNAVCCEIRANADDFEDCEVVALRLGAGTASNAGEGIWDMVRTIRECFAMAENAQVTMRTALSNISGANMPYFRRAGVSRFDFEMMSVYQPCFARFNHVDNFADFPIARGNFLHSYANDSLGLNLLYGHCDLSTLEFRRCMLATNDMNVSHVQLQLASPEFRGDDSLVAQHLSDAREVLGSAGLTEYLPGVFAKTGCEDTYLLGRARKQETLAFGLGARTAMDGSVSTNTSDLATYLEASDDFARITVDVHAAAESEHPNAH